VALSAQFPDLSEQELKDLARATGHRFASVVLQFPRGGPDMDGQQSPPWLAEVASGLRPLADSVAGALDLLRRTVPGIDDDTRL
jgi:hypothetical protein